jgi:2-dehydro-3-deoxygluconokinase
VVENAAAPTGIYFVMPDPEGRDFSYYRAGSAASCMTPADLPEATIKAAKILHVSAISQAISPSASALVLVAMETAKRAGVLVSYDTNLRLNLWPLEEARQVIHRAMTGCDIALPSLDDSRLLTGLEDQDAIVDFYHDLGARSVALKLGEAGALISTEKGRKHVPAHKVQAVDATGAGDTFDGTFLATLLITNCPFTAAERAVVAAALTTTGIGAVAPIPSLQDVDAILKRTRQRALKM